MLAQTSGSLRETHNIQLLGIKGTRSSERFVIQLTQLKKYKEILFLSWFIKEILFFKMSYVLTCVHENRGPNQAQKPIWIRAYRTVWEVNFLVTLARFIYLASAESVHLFSLFDYFTACRRLREVMISLSISSQFRYSVRTMYSRLYFQFFLKKIPCLPCVCINA